VNYDLWTRDNFGPQFRSLAGLFLSRVWLTGQNAHPGGQRYYSPPLSLSTAAGLVTARLSPAWWLLVGWCTNLLLYGQPLNDNLLRCL